MLLRVFVLLCSLLVPLLLSANVAVFVPAMANSQVLFNKRVSEELLHAGHSVTMYMVQVMEHTLQKVDIDSRIRVEWVNASYGVDGDEMMRMQSEIAFYDVPIWDARFRMMMSKFSEMYKSCELMINNATFMAHVESSHYDIAFTHMYNFCGIGVIHVTKIPTWVWLNSGALMDNVATAIGVPLPPSYCTPMMMDASDEMNFFERTKSFIGHTLNQLMWKRLTADKETACFQQKYGEDFPNLADLAKEVPLVMVNSNELYDFARPTLHKVVNIGGVGIKTKDAKNLTGEFAVRAEAAVGGIVTMTFGSVAPMYLMPPHWKDAYFAAFRQFPTVQFFLRYEKPEEIASLLPPNAYAAKWLPQTDLLQHPKSLGLISHGGYNSVQDVIHAGVPIMATALFGDQPRNAHLVEKLGVGIYMKKADVSETTVTAAIHRIVHDKSLKKNAQRLRAMVASKPISAETLLHRWTDFLVEHKELDNLVPTGRDFSLWKYHSLDVISFLLVVLSLLLFLLFSLLRCCARRCCCSKKASKKEKTN